MRIHVLQIWIKLFEFFALVLCLKVKLKRRKRIVCFLTVASNRRNRRFVKVDYEKHFKTLFCEKCSNDII